jgi:hypothetical protein
VVAHGTDTVVVVLVLRVTWHRVQRALFSVSALARRGVWRQLECNSDSALNRVEERYVSEHYIEAQNYRPRAVVVPWNFAARMTAVASPGRTVVPAAALPGA